MKSLSDNRAASYKLTFQQKPAYLHATVTGLNTRENIMQYMSEILSECKARHCTQVLVEERLEGPRLPMFDIFEIAAHGSMEALGVLKAVAYVDINAAGDGMRFAETVARNRAMPVAIFSNVADAEKWLTG